MFWNKRKNLNLDLNESAFDSLSSLRPMWIDFLSLVNQYLREDEHKFILQKIAENHGLSSEQVVLFNGSWHGLMTIFSFLFHDKDEIIVPVPTFPFYQPFEELGQLKIKKISGLAKDINRQNISLAINDSTKGIYLVNPTNPLGELLPQDKVEEIIKMAEAKGILVILDEAYSDFAFIDSSILVNKYNNLIILKSGSKSLGLAGVRFGYVLTNKIIAHKLNFFRGPSYTISSLSLLAFKLIIDNKKKLNTYIQENNLVRGSLEVILSNKNIKFFESQTNFVSFYYPNPASLKDKLFAEGILIKTLSDYPDGQAVTKDLIRISIPSKKDWPRLKKVLERVL